MSKLNETRRGEMEGGVRAPLLYRRLLITNTRWCYREYAGVLRRVVSSVFRCTRAWGVHIVTLLVNLEASGSP